MDGLCLKFSGQSRTHSRPLRVEDGAMKEFISKYADRIHGVLSCFDRMLFRGYLPIMSGWPIAPVFNRSNIRYRELKPLLLEHAARVKQHGVDLAQKEGRPFIRYTKHENAFLWIEDMARAQAFSDRFASLEWPRILNPYARKVNPLMEDLIESLPYYWVTAQSEYSTDILFKSASHLSELYPRLRSHSTLCFGAKEVMSFLGKKIRSQFEGEVVTDVSDLSFKRIAGSRIKHRVKQNWLKMYDKAGSVLRLEMVINDPEGFTVRKEGARKGKKVFKWVDMLKGVAYLFPYKDVSLAANGRYLNALAQVDDPTDAIPTLDRIRTPTRPCKEAHCAGCDTHAGLPNAEICDHAAGQHMIRGFTNPDIRQILKDSPHLHGIADPKRKSAKVTRILNRCHAHGLIAKIPHSRRWRVAKHGRIAMSAAVQLRDVQFPISHLKAAA